MLIAGLAPWPSVRADAYRTATFEENSAAVFKKSAESYTLFGWILMMADGNYIATEVMTMAVAAITSADWDNEDDNDGNNYYNN